MNANVYYEQDADNAVLAGQRLAVLGYGSQGRAHALNLRDSGLDVVVGLRSNSSSSEQARADGLDVLSIDEAVRAADVVAFLMPEPVQPRVYTSHVEPNLNVGTSLLFAHGFNVHYGQITPPATSDVVMIAPKGPGNLVRQLYQDGQGVPCLLAVEQDASGTAHAKGLAYGHALGGTRAGVIETSFREETETDLFGEQTVLCGGVSELVKAGYETLVDAGYNPEMAYFECLNELKLIVDLLYQGGLSQMHRFVSETASYGSVTRGPRVIDEHVRENMQAVLHEIQDGSFAREWVLENQANQPVFEAKTRADKEHPVEAVGEQLRDMMSWLTK